MIPSLNSGKVSGVGYAGDTFDHAIISGMPLCPTSPCHPDIPHRGNVRLGEDRYGHRLQEGGGLIPDGLGSSPAMAAGSTDGAVLPRVLGPILQPVPTAQCSYPYGPAGRFA